MRSDITKQLRTHLYLVTLTIVAAGLSLNAVVARVGQPSTISVTTTNDDFTNNGNCSLREAIRAANTDSAVDACPAGDGADTILLPAGVYTLSIIGANENADATGDLDLASDLTIHGAGADTTIIDGHQLDRVFDIQLLATITITSLTIQNGASGDNSGGAILHSGAALTLTQVAVVGNSTRTGGGIASTSALILNDSSIRDNIAFDRGGGIWSTGTLTITNSTVSRNSAGRGGGINSAGTLFITSSAVISNTAERGGGLTNTGAITMTNSTISGNQAGHGGGIDSLGELAITSSTISANHASQGGGMFNNGGRITIGSTILAGNANDAGSSPNCVGTLISKGYNLFQSPQDCIIDGDTTGNRTTTDARLGPLSDNGGPTLTHALLLESPAIDAGSLPSCSSLDACLPSDQRGESRPRDGDGDGQARCDIGAYELQHPDSAPYPIGMMKHSIYVALVHRA
jgi:CSLREA domain-containing protein